MVKKNMNNNMSVSFTKSFGTPFLLGHFSRNLHFDRHFNIISFFESLFERKVFLILN